MEVWGSLYSVNSTTQFDLPAHTPPGLASQKRPVIHIHQPELSEHSHRRQRTAAGTEDQTGPLFGEALSRLLLGGVDTQDQYVQPEVILGNQTFGGSSSTTFRLNGGSQSPPSNLQKQRSQDGQLAAEVARIRSCISDDFRSILAVELQESDDQELQIQAVQSQYRQIMRLLHPDKRSPSSESMAGGKVACDEAMELVQNALKLAKKEIEAGPDPSKVAMDSMRRMQEVQRQRARAAMNRQHEAEVSSLFADVESALASELDLSFMPGFRTSSTATHAASYQPSSDRSTDQQILNLLAQLRPSSEPIEIID